MNDPWDYVKAVVAGDITTGLYIKKACKKLLNEYEIRQHEDDYPWLYHEGRAKHFVDFTKCCKYPDGTVAGKQVKLHPWQLFVFSMAYGWRSKKDVNIPRFNDIYTRVARKNDKTTGLTTIMLYELLTGPQGHEEYITAVNREQAGIAFRKAVTMADSLPPALATQLKLTYGKLKNTKNGSFLVARSRENKASDGASCRRGYWDEAARIEDEESYDILHSSQGSWKGSHQNFYISTAQANRETRYYHECEVGRQILDGNNIPPDHLDRKLYILYELDQNDDWDDPDKWIKANPSLGLSTDMEFLQQQCYDAKVSPAKRSEFLRKYCNLYTAAEDPWMDVQHWDDQVVPKLHKKGPCYVGLDMGKTSDLNAISILWVNPDGFYEADFKAFLPQEAVEKAPKHVINIYRRAIESGILELTPGHTINHDYIKTYIRDLCASYDVAEVVFDPYKSQQLMTELEAEGLNMVQQRQGRVSLGPGISETERIITSDQIVHLGNPFISWQLGNCQINVDKHDLPELTKPKDYAMKIDNIIALTMCVSRATVHGGLNISNPSVFII